MAKRFQITHSFFVTLTLAIMLTSTSTGSVGPTPPPGAQGDKFLLDCAAKIAVCGTEVFNSVFNGVPVSPNCCISLVRMGKPCHDGLVRHFVSQPFFKGDKARVLASSQKTWNACVAVPPRAS